MKLLVVSESPLDLVNGAHYAVDPWIRLPLQFAAYADVTLWAPVRFGRAAPPSEGWRVDLGRMRLEPQDFYNSFASYYRLWPRRVLAWRRRARTLASENDVVILRVPSPSLSLVARAVRAAGTPLVFVVVGDMLSQSDRIMGSRGPKRVLYTWMTRLLADRERRWGRHAAVVYTYNQELTERHRCAARPVRRLRDPHLSLDDIVAREDTCRSQEIRLLRVAWLLPSKGIEHLLQSVAILKSHGRRVRLEIVGKERVAGYEESLRARARQLGIDDVVTFSGWVPFTRIREVYLRSDVQVISSLAEGSPRCIDEGAAHGVPLVCTRVGGCVDVLDDERTALLVPPADPGAMAAAVERVIDDGALRRRLIANGYALARAATFEKVGVQFLDDLRELASGFRSHGPSVSIELAERARLAGAAGWREATYRSAIAALGTGDVPEEDERSADWRYLLPSACLGGTALVLGAGLGTVPSALATMFERVYVADRSLARLQLLARRAAELELGNIHPVHVGGAEGLPFRPGRFGLVVARMETGGQAGWMPGGSGRRLSHVLRSVADLVAPGGASYWTLDNRWSYRRLARPWRVLAGDARSMRGYRRLLHALGFARVDFHAPLPRHVGVPLFYVPLAGQGPGKHFVRRLFALFDTAPPELKERHALEYWLARLAVRASGLPGFAALAMGVVPGFGIVASRAGGCSID